MALPGGAYQGNAVTTVRGDVFIPEIWSNEIKRSRDVSLIAANTVRKIPMVGRKGDLIRIPSISRMAVYDKIAETPVQLQARTETAFSIIIDKYKESSFMVEDILRIQADYDLMAEYTREVGYALARDLDNFILALRASIQGYNSASNIVWVTSTGAQAGTPQAVSRAAILTAKQILDESDVPMEGRKMLVSPGQYNDLLTITEFISADYSDGRPTQTGKVGQLFGMEVMMSSNVTTNSLTGYVNGAGAPGQPTPGVTGSPYLPTQSDQTITTLPYLGDGTSTGNFATAMIYHPDWAILAVQKNPNSESSRENLFQANAVVNTQVYGAKVYRPDHCVLLHTAP